MFDFDALSDDDSAEVGSKAPSTAEARSVVAPAAAETILQRSHDPAASGVLPVPPPRPATAKAAASRIQGSGAGLAELAAAETARAEAALAATLLRTAGAGAAVAGVGPPATLPPAQKTASTSVASTFREAQAPVAPVWAADAALPRRSYRVVHSAPVAVRSAPSLDAAVIERRPPGALVEAVEETFVGWIRLAGEASWMLRDMQGSAGLGLLLEATGIDPEEVLPAPELAEDPGDQTFEVLSQDGVYSRERPEASAQALKFFDHGEKIVAASQSYNGWLRLADSDAWVPSRSDGAPGRPGRPLLRCLFIEERRRRIEEQLEAEEKAAREAAVERQVELERSGRKSDWWTRLDSVKGDVKAQRPIASAAKQRVRLPIHPSAAAAVAVGASEARWYAPSSASSAPRPSSSDKGAKAALPPDKVAQAWRLELRVGALVSAVPVRALPSLRAPVLGRLLAGECASVVEETFDGWSRLSDNSGWIQRVLPSGGELDLFELHPPACPSVEAPPSMREPLLVVSPSASAEEEADAESGSADCDAPVVGALITAVGRTTSPRPLLEVVSDAGCPVFSYPCWDAVVSETKCCGEIALAERQTYDGWIALADDAGWMPGFERDGTRRLLRVLSSDS